ncbi:molybdopterin molybdotransferase MoeA [Helicobacter sp. 23-1044]
MMDLDKYLELLSGLKVAHKGEKRISILKAKGRILSENITCKIPIPRFDNSAMDGYAVRFERGAKPYKSYCIKGSIFAGDSREYILQKNDTFCIMTGAKVPKNCDCIVQKEKVEIRGSEAILQVTPQKNQCIKFCGEDFKKGEILLKKGAILDSNAIGILATQGISKVCVKKRVKIIIFGSGNEIAPLDSPLKNNQIYDINSHFIRANFGNLNCKIKYGGILGDSAKTLKSALKKAAQKYDIIITSGGVSVGEKDYIHAVLAKMGAKILSDGINIKPGRPVVLSKFSINRKGRESSANLNANLANLNANRGANFKANLSTNRKDCFILSLPGNPIGAFLQSYFCLPILVAKFSGVPFKGFDSLIDSREMPNGADFRATKGTAHIMLGSVKDWQFFAFNGGKYQGAQVAPLLQSSAFAIIQSKDFVKKGEIIRILPYKVKFMQNLA